MLPPFIIDQIRQREEECRKKDLERPRVELPVDLYHPAPEPRGEEDESGERGVTILDLG